MDARVRTKLVVLLTLWRVLPNDGVQRDDKAASVLYFASSRTREGQRYKVLYASEREQRRR